MIALRTEATGSGVMFGCDPELFITKNGKVIGSEMLLGTKPLVVKKDTYDKGNNKIIVDGVAAELNVTPNYCRALVGNNIGRLLRALDRKAAEKGMALSLSPTVKILKKNLLVLRAESQQFGCQPSLNVYGDRIPEDVDGMQFRYRSAGGHIHFGHDKSKVNLPWWNKVAEVPNLIKLLDIFVGNTAVIFDRDKGSRVRRAMYGKAGEYRINSHGTEYRVPSNFWLAAPVMWSILCGLGQTAFLVRGAKERDEKYCKEMSRLGYTDRGGTSRFTGDNDPEEFIFSRVDQSLVRDAINTNNYRKAMITFTTVVDPFLRKFAPSKGLIGEHLPQFYYLAEKVKEVGLHAALGMKSATISSCINAWVRRDTHETGWGDWCRAIQGNPDYTAWAAKNAKKYEVSPGL